MLYTKEVMKHFKNPKNVGKMKNYDGLGKVGNLRCGDIMYLYLKIGKNKKNKEIIKDIKFETFGCTVAIANTSLLTTMVKGKTLKEASRVTKDDLLKKFGDIPFVKIHCSLLAADALGEAIYDYLSKNNRAIPEELQERHKRVQKDRKTMQESHSELLKLEEDLHKK